MRNTRAPLIPRLWLLTDQRTAARLDNAIRQLPRGSAIVFRHYHLTGDARWAAFRHVQRLARLHGHIVVLSGPAALARQWRAAGIYGAPASLGRPSPGLIRIATVHNPRERRQAQLMRADAVMISPVFATRSHPGAATLGPLKLAALARHAGVPVIALGGMTGARARRLPCAIRRWAAIDGLG